MEILASIFIIRNIKYTYIHKFYDLYTSQKSSKSTNYEYSDISSLYC